MSEIPYTSLTGKIKAYFDKFREAGIPPKVNNPWLNSLGFKSGNDYYIVGVLKYIKFIDSSGVPTDFWRQFKDPSKSKAVMAQAIKQGYGELFATYSDASKRSRDEIYAVFSSKSGKAKTTVDYMVNTFVNLCQLADFEAPSVLLAQPSATPSPTPAVPTQITGAKLPITPEGGVRLDVSIRIELPVTQDADVYDKIFKSLKKYLLTPSSESD
jgi:hypothetical protein